MSVLMSTPLVPKSRTADGEVPESQDFVTISDLLSKPGDATVAAGWARNLSVVPLDLEEILRSIEAQEN